MVDDESEREGRVGLLMLLAKKKENTPDNPETLVGRDLPRFGGRENYRTTDLRTALSGHAAPTRTITAVYCANLGTRSQPMLYVRQTACNGGYFCATYTCHAVPKYLTFVCQGALERQVVAVHG